MKTKTMNMFAETNEDMPIISGMAHTDVIVVTIPDNAGNLHAFKMDSDPFDGHFVEAMCIIKTSGLDGIKRIEDWMDDHRVMACYNINHSYNKALIAHAKTLGITVKHDFNTTFNGFYRLSDAIEKVK